MTVTCEVLTVEPQKGSVYFESTPPGARIFIDGSDTGISTPATVPDIVVGTHNFTLTKAGYNNFTGTVEVITDQLPTISVTLIPAEGCVYFDSYPQGAIIIVGGLDTTLTTPNLVCGYSIGIHTYVLRLTNYNDATGSVSLVPGEGTSISRTLVHEKGGISFNSSPQGAEIFIDGVDQNRVTPNVITDILTGSHTYVLKLSGYNDYAGVANVSVGQTVDVVTVLIPIEGCIYFESTPAGAMIIIDEIDTMLTTPNLACGLSLGVHNYRLVLAGYQDTTGTVNLATGQGTIVTTILLTPANVISATLTVDKNDCIASCTVNGTVSWTNTGGTASDPTDLGIAYNGNLIPVASGVAIGPGQTLSYTFSISGLTAGTYQICASPDSGTTCQAVIVRTPANIVATAITPSVATCIAPCDMTVDITWTNNGETSGTFIPTITVNGTPTTLPEGSLDPGESITKTFSLTGLVVGAHTICSEPNTFPCATVTVTSVTQAGFGGAGMVLMAGLVVGAIYATTRKSKTEK